LPPPKGDNIPLLLRFVPFEGARRRIKKRPSHKGLSHFNKDLF